MSIPSTARRWPFGLYAILTLLTLQAIAQGLLLFGIVTNRIPGFRAAYDVTGLSYYSWLGQLFFSVVALAGLWTGRSWSWTLIMIFLAITMTVDILEHLNGQSVYVSMFLNVLTVFYLNQREVRSLFIDTKATGRVP